MTDAGTPSSQPSGAASPSGPPIGRMIALLALASFASASAFRICDPMLPQLAEEFGTTTGQAAHAVTIFAIAYGLLQFFFGPVGDRYGKFRTVAVATLLCAAGSAGVAMAPSMDVLLACRFLSGAAGAGIVPLSMAWIGDNVPYEQRQVTLARFLTGTITGMAAGQVLGGAFASTLGWRWGFVFLAAGYLCTGMLLLRGSRRLPVEATAGARTQFLAPMASVLRISWARLILSVAFLEGAVVFGVLSFVPAYLQHRFGVTPMAAGLLTGVYALGGLTYVVVARRLVPALGEAGLAASGGALLAVAFLLYWLGGDWGWSIAAGMLCGFGYYLLHSTLQAHATQMAPKVRGTAVALFACVLFLGQSAGVAAGGVVVDHLGMTWLFVAGVVGCPLVAGAFVTALRRRDGGQVSRVRSR
jgi:Arabinose efflux permease